MLEPTTSARGGDASPLCSGSGLLAHGTSSVLRGLAEPGSVLLPRPATDFQQRVVRFGVGQCPPQVGRSCCVRTAPQRPTGGDPPHDGDHRGVLLAARRSAGALPQRPWVGRRRAAQHVVQRLHPLQLARHTDGEHRQMRPLIGLGTHPLRQLVVPNGRLLAVAPGHCRHALRHERRRRTICGMCGRQVVGACRRPAGISHREFRCASHGCGLLGCEDEGRSLEMPEYARSAIELAQAIKHASTPSRTESGIAADAVGVLANMLRRLSEAGRAQHASTSRLRPRAPSHQGSCGSGRAFESSA